MPSKQFQTPNVEAFSDRRREPRTPASGKAIVRLEGGKRVVAAEMMDVSSSGFRLRYRGAPLDTNSEVDVTYTLGNVKAAIVWSHLQEGWCEVGFLITNRKSQA